MGEADQTCEVLIVGAGPAGLSVASALPDDVRTVIVHQDKEIGLPVRTSGGSWLSDIKRIGIPNGMFNRLTKNEIFADDAHGYLPLDQAAPVVLDTPEVYRWLARQSDKKDRELLLASKFITTRALADGRYESDIRLRDGAERRIVSRYIVDASGWHFAVLTALGLANKPERLGIGTEYEYPIGENDPNRGVIFLGSKVPSGYGWSFGTARGTLRIGVGVIQPDTDESPKELLDAVVRDTAFLDRLGLKLAGDPIVHSGILPSVRYDDRMVFGNVIRVGDSAGFATPALGEGIRICIDLGKVLGAQLGEAVKTGRHAPLMAYERQCRRRLKRDYKWGFQMNTRIARYGPKDWDAAVRRIGKLGPDAVVATFRGEFPLHKIVKITWQVWRTLLRSRLRRLGAKLGLS